MPEAITKEFIRTMAAANGFTIPEERLEVVLRQYESFMRTLEEINSLPLPREAEPAIIYSLQDQLPAAVPGSASRR